VVDFGATLVLGMKKTMFIFVIPGQLDRGLSPKLQVLQIWGQILLENEGMIEDYSKIPYKKNLKMNLYNLKDLWQGQWARDWKIISIQGSWCYKKSEIQRI